MSSIAQETKEAVHAAGRSTTSTTRRRVVAEPQTVPARRIVADDRASRTTALVFQAVLFCAMCVSLLAVIQQASSTDSSHSSVSGTGVNDAPPAVFVNAD
ncbi:MAG: hypothetical protein R2733_09460 [Acidimicrobiales bacterium]